MDYFGLFFAYVIPGIIIGTVAVVTIRDELIKSRRRDNAKKRACETERRTKLYIHTIEAPGPKTAA